MSLFKKRPLSAPMIPASDVHDERPSALDLNGPVDACFEPLAADWVDVPIVSSLCRVAARHPERIAVRDRDAALSYRDFVAAAARLSVAISRSPAPHKAIGLLLPNSAAYPVAVIACLAARRACVPFDLHYPSARIADLIKSAALDAVVVGEGVDGLQILPPDLARIDGSLRLDGAAPDLAHADVFGPDKPALILHTSGSSGRPKAVVISQASLLQRVLQHVNASHIGPSDQICPLSSPCTISGVREQVTALLTGATLHMIDPHREKLSELRRLIGELRISIVYAVPALLRAIVQADGLAEDLLSLRVVRLGGDTILWRDVALLRNALSPESRIQIGFSSTESPGMQWFVPSGFPMEGATAPLGYELPGMRFEVIDDTGAAVRPGEIGELVIRSRFVALGHWENGMCVPGPFCADPETLGARVNVSGDLVIKRRDGLYVYAGRKDRQVKIRGQRVDTSEVEAILRAVAGVVDTAVIAVPGASEASLVAFVQARAGVQIEAVRRQMDQALRGLPEAMRPSRLHVVAAIPRLPSAKLDVASLRALDRVRRTARAPARRIALSDAPQIERIVAQAWREALGLRTEREDLTWSEAGGDSLRLLEFVLHVERRIGRDLPLEMFDADNRPHDVVKAINGLLQSVSPLKGGDGCPLAFFFPGIDGDSVAQARFRRSLGHLVRFEVITYPDWREMVGDGGGLERLVDLACARILEMSPDVPVRLAGYSFGAVAALALASRLAGQNRQVVWLAVFDADLEQYTKPPTQVSQLQASVFQRLSLARRLSWKQRLQRMMAVGWKPTVLSLFSWLTIRRRPGPLPFSIPIPRQLPRSVEFRLRETMRRDMMAAWLRQAKAKSVELPITLYRTGDHTETASPDLGWSAFAGPVRTCRVDGDHKRMFSPPHHAVLADQFARMHFGPSGGASPEIAPPKACSSVSP